MLFGTAVRLSKQNRDLEVLYNERKLKATKTYKYLGVEIDTSLNLNNHFRLTYKKCSSRLRLLSKLRPLLTTKAASIIYHSMILPVLTYCCLLMLKNTATQKLRYLSIDNRATNIINDVNTRIMKIENYKRRHACNFVKNCLENESCENFNNYFSLIDHGKNTRNNKNTIKLPKVRTEFAKKSSFFMAAKMYNELPMHVRNDKNSFTSSLNKHFS